MNNAKLSPANIVILVAGAVMLVASFLGFYKFNLPAALGGSRTFSAWSDGQFLIATLPALLGVVMAAQIALVAFGNLELPDRVLGLTWDQIHLALGFQAALMMIAWIFANKFGLDIGIGFWLMLLAGIALAVGAVLRQQEAPATAL